MSLTNLCMHIRHQLQSRWTLIRSETINEACISDTPFAFGMYMSQSCADVIGSGSLQCISLSNASAADDLPCEQLCSHGIEWAHGPFASLKLTNARITWSFVPFSYHENCDLLAYWICVTQESARPAVPHVVIISCHLCRLPPYDRLCASLF